MATRLGPWVEPICLEFAIEALCFSCNRTPSNELMSILLRVRVYGEAALRHRLRKGSAIAANCEKALTQPKRRRGLPRKHCGLAGDTNSAGQKGFQNKPTWEVDRIVGSMCKNGERYYKVKWEETWEPAENLRGCAETAIAEFEL